MKDNKERRANHSPFLFKQNNMITDILEDRQKDQAPRFFLHDEMTIWLREHLRLSISDQVYDEQWVDSVAEAGTAYAYREQLKLSGRRNIYVTPMIAGAMMPTNGFEIDLSPYRSAIVSLTKRVSYLEQNNQDLRNFINQLESRIIKLEQHANI